jgi:hypothetical protein
VQCDGVVPAVQAFLLFIQHAKTANVVSKENMLVCVCGEKWKRNCENYVTILLGVMTRYQCCDDTLSPLRYVCLFVHVHFVCSYAVESNYLRESYS